MEEGCGPCSSTRALTSHSRRLPVLCCTGPGIADIAWFSPGCSIWCLKDTGQWSSSLLTESFLTCGMTPVLEWKKSLASLGTENKGLASASHYPVMVNTVCSTTQTLASQVLGGFPRANFLECAGRLGGLSRSSQRKPRFLFVLFYEGTFFLGYLSSIRIKVNGEPLSLCQNSFSSSTVVPPSHSMTFIILELSW